MFLGFDSAMAIVIFGAAMAVALGGIGSAIGVGIAGQTAAGVTAEKPDLFGRMLVLEALPGTQGIYGFIGAFLILFQTGFITGAPLPIDLGTAWQFFYASFPVGLGGLFSGIYQGKVAAAGMGAVAKDPANTGKAMILAAMVETYAVLGLLLTVLLVFGIVLPK